MSDNKQPIITPEMKKTFDILISYGFSETDARSVVENTNDIKSVEEASKNLYNIPEPVSPIDEMLLEFSKELKPEEIPDFGPDFYNKLFDIHRERMYKKHQPRLKLVMNKKNKTSTRLKLVFNKLKVNSNIQNSGLNLN